MLCVPSDGLLATQHIAEAFAEVVRSGDVVVLTGDLGAGKTTFVRSFAAALGVTEPVTSPTFTLVHEYVGRLRVHHLDVYRLSSPEEADDLALAELLDDGGVCLIEWGNLIGSELPAQRLEITIALGDPSQPDARVFEFSGSELEWADRLSQMANVLAAWPTRACHGVETGR